MADPRRVGVPPKTAKQETEMRFRIRNSNSYLLFSIAVSDSQVARSMPKVGRQDPGPAPFAGLLSPGVRAVDKSDKNLAIDGYDRSDAGKNRWLSVLLLIKIC
jgi:hypothetical protein